MEIRKGESPEFSLRLMAEIPFPTHLECMKPYINNRKNYQQQLVRRISAINSITHFLRCLVRSFWESKTLPDFCCWKKKGTDLHQTSFLHGYHWPMKIKYHIKPVFFVSLFLGTLKWVHPNWTRSCCLIKVQLFDFSF